MKAYIFPGQASQFVGMGADLFENSDRAKDLMLQANEILGFDILKLMFEGPEDMLKETNVTQPAVFIHSVVKVLTSDKSMEADAVAGHSLGELSALVAAGILTYPEGLVLVKARADAMQKACEANPGTMAAVVGLENQRVEEICSAIDDVVVPANYNCPGQLVISGTISGIESAMDACRNAGAIKVIPLSVGGAFHSPLMLPAEEELGLAIDLTNFRDTRIPIYQNVNATSETEIDKIRDNLKKQLTAPVRWTQTIQNMIADGIGEFVEVGGNGKVLSGFVRRVDRSMPTTAL